jgi:nitrogen fixation protein FixH
MRRYAKAIIAVLALAALGSAVCASVSFTPPSGKAMYVASMPLEATKAAGKATATVTMVCRTDLTTGMMTVQANGLDPKGVYTVWLVKTIPAKGQQKAKTEMTGVGKAPYQMAVTAKGFANLKADVANCKEAVMQRLEVVKHPSGGPTQMSGIVPVFSADLSKLLQDKKPQ